ncbi:galactosylceramide sulfotransferase-like [Branchiostoma floridae]|uniref:Galactosylceramide sulfotransferase-like n=1 Tax=Branchiostoma floridae TaxID=7739 RepID=A0A9J7MIJ1_BRAFL|nr:galactosylceramide sulfotransferase-like [Branchiostoma floridae]
MSNMKKHCEESRYRRIIMLKKRAVFVVIVGLLFALLRYVGLHVSAGEVLLRNIFQVDMSNVGKCSAKSNIVFLKTHKTAGSTVQNILMRYGLDNNLSFALPRTGHRFQYPWYFEKGSVLQENTNKENTNKGNTNYNILCHHTRFHYENIRDLMPNDSVYITVVRSPGKIFRSAFEYFQLRRKFHITKENAMEAFLDDPSYYVGRYSKTRFSRNPMFFDLGYDPHQLASEASIRNAIDYLDRIFSLVLVSDHFEESMVLLKHTLCWDINDITYFKLNERETNSTEELTKNVEEKIRQWNKADSMLFDHFNRSLWEKLSQLPYNWKKELNVLQQKNKDLEAKCINTRRISSNIKDENFRFFQPPGVSVLGIVLNDFEMQNKICVHMAKAEVPFTQELKQMYKKSIRK